MTWSQSSRSACISDHRWRTQWTSAENCHLGPAVWTVHLQLSFICFIVKLSSLIAGTIATMKITSQHVHSMYMPCYIFHIIYNAADLHGQLGHSPWSISAASLPLGSIHTCIDMPHSHNTSNSLPNSLKWKHGTYESGIIYLLRLWKVPCQAMRSLILFVHHSFY